MMSRQILLGMLAALSLLAIYWPMAQSSGWPPLPNDGYIAGRAAVAADVASGRAAFVLADGDLPIGRPMSIEIPQYAIFNSEGQRMAVILIQAEEARGQKIAAGRMDDGTHVVGLLGDFELLGVSMPASYR